MAYTPTTWVNNVPGVTAGTKVNATNMNKIEAGIQAAHELVEALAVSPAVLAGKLYMYKNIGGAL